MRAAVEVDCRLCGRAATTTTVYAVERLEAYVEHHTCERHTGRLRADMLEAGWTVADAG